MIVDIKNSQFVLRQIADHYWHFHNMRTMFLVHRVGDEIVWQFTLPEHTHASCIAVFADGRAVFIPVDETLDDRIPPSDLMDTVDEAIAMSLLSGTF